MNENSRTAWLGLGGNVGDVRATLAHALGLLDDHPHIAVEAVSGLYATPPWGRTDQAEFLNASARINTSLTPHALLETCLETERALGRVRGERWGPRTIDIDLLAMEGVDLADEKLTLPHPRLHERSFALAPLNELAPDLSVSGKTIGQWLDGADVSGIRRVSKAQEWFAPVE